jgi:hypothetical protein
LAGLSILIKNQNDDDIDIDSLVAEGFELLAQDELLKGDKGSEATPASRELVFA